MTETSQEVAEKEEPESAPTPSDGQERKDREDKADNYYRIQFRCSDQIFSAKSRIANLPAQELLMVQTDHGPEPAHVISHAAKDENETCERKASYLLLRRATREEISKFDRLIEREKDAFETCKQHIVKHKLEMKLIKVERFFNGSKIIFFFTAENRVDFRELVKDLVQEFRTRVEIRQVGVRHETKMIGGLGSCGRELCCSSFIKDFAPVSIKMAKEQNLPLNPSKISGVCNRLLCCLTYEYDTYHELRRGLPKLGKTVKMDGVDYKVTQVNVLEGHFTLMELGNRDNTQIMKREEWETIRPAVPDNQPKGDKARKKPRKKGKSGGQRGGNPRGSNPRGGDKGGPQGKKQTRKA